MDAAVEIRSLQMLNQLWLTLLLLIPMILTARAVVAGTRYSPILIIVVFGLAMGAIMVGSEVSTTGLPEFPLVDLVGRLTIIALVASFFSGGQELKRILWGQKLRSDDLVVLSQEEVVLGTRRSQFMFIVRAFFILIGIEGLRRVLVGVPAADPLAHYYLLFAYIGLMGSVILIDHKATIRDKPLYLRKGLLETAGILGVLFGSFWLAELVAPLVSLPQIFFAMILSSSLGMLLSSWQPGPTLRALLFAGIPVVLAANFMIGGSRIIEGIGLSGMTTVVTYGFFGQMFWMFGGLALLIALGHANHVRNLAPGMAGALSHAGLTGACTAGDMGPQAAARAPIMINIPFFGHVFVFSILALSVQQGALLLTWAVLVTAVGLVLTALALFTLRGALGEESREVRGLMLFSLGWQLTALFGGLLVLHLSGMPLTHAAMATSSALSHFGLFAAVQGGMFGEQAATLIPFIFAMPFLVHPLVFGAFGRAMDQSGKMSTGLVYTVSLVGLVGILYALLA